MQENIETSERTTTIMRQNDKETIKKYFINKKTSKILSYLPMKTSHQNFSPDYKSYVSVHSPFSVDPTHAQAFHFLVSTIDFQLPTCLVFPNSPSSIHKTYNKLLITLRILPFAYYKILLHIPDYVSSFSISSPPELVVKPPKDVKNYLPSIKKMQCRCSSSVFLMKEFVFYTCDFWLPQNKYFPQIYLMVAHHY